MSSPVRRRCSSVHCSRTTTDTALPEMFLWGTLHPCATLSPGVLRVAQFSLGSPKRLNTMSAVTILVVDDAPHWRKFVGFILRIDPALEIVCEASDGASAVKQAKELQPAIVLLDISLPDVCGIEVGRRIVSTLPAAISSSSASSPRSKSFNEHLTWEPWVLS